MDKAKAEWNAGQWTKHDSGMECRGRDEVRYRHTMPGKGRKRDIGLPGRAMDEKERNGIPQQWTKRKRHRMPGKGRSEISAYQAGQWTKKSGMVFRNNGQSESGIECRGRDEVRSAYQAGQWTKKSGMECRHNGQSESGMECRGRDKVRSAYQAGQWTKEGGMECRGKDEVRSA